MPDALKFTAFRFCIYVVDTSLGVYLLRITDLIRHSLRTSCIFMAGTGFLDVDASLQFVPIGLS